MIFQILIFVWMQVAPMQLRAADGAQILAQAKPIPPMPQNYRLPDMRLLDTVAFLYKYKDQVGQRVDVEGFVGRFGATFGPEFKQKIYEIEHQYEEKIEIILTLSSTIEDAKILKDKLEKTGRKMVIVEIPDWLQERIIEKATLKTQAKLSPIAWNSNALIKITNPKNIREAAVNATNILKNQYVKPTQKDIKLAAVSATRAGVLTTVGLVLAVGNMDPMVVAAYATASALFAGTMEAFSKTIGNYKKTSITDELKVKTGVRKMVSESYYAIVFGALGSFGNYGATQAVSDTMNTVVGNTVASVKEKKINEKAREKMFWYTFAFGTAMGLLGAMGIGSELVLDYGVLKLSKMFVSSVIISGSLYLLYKHKSKKIEEFVEMDKRELLRLDLGKIIPLRKDTRTPNLTITVGKSQTFMPASCSSLFSF